MLMNCLCSRMVHCTLYGNPYRVFVVIDLYIILLLFIFCMFIAIPHHTNVLAVFCVCVCVRVCAYVCACACMCVRASTTFFDCVC